MSLLQYLSNYACAEASCPAPPASYDEVLVVPAFDESTELLQGFSPALGERSLCIVVVNASEERSAAEKERSAYLAEALSAGADPLSPGICYQHRPVHGDLVIVDRASEGRLLPPKQGVGLARKIGFDMALAWQNSGLIRSPFIHTTDADARLPSGYFQAAKAAWAPGRRAPAALCYPFWHQCERSSTQGRALELYEMSLRYYVLGLAWAGSPFAFHCIGSTMAVHKDAYLAVRGMPKRQAGEDFYLLNKVAKLGPVVRPECAPILLQQRASQRTPFGTGPATRSISDQLLRGEEQRVYDPRIFALLREWIEVINEIARCGSLEPMESLTHEELESALYELGARAAFEEALSGTTTEAARWKRLHGWFDGFRTLKLIHALRDEGLENQPWREAYDAAPFIPSPGEDESLRQAMARRERKVLKAL